MDAKPRLVAQRGRRAGGQGHMSEVPCHRAPEGCLLVRPIFPLSPNGLRSRHQLGMEGTAFLSLADMCPGSPSSKGRVWRTLDSSYVTVGSWPFGVSQGAGPGTAGPMGEGREARPGAGSGEPGAGPPAAPLCPSAAVLGATPAGLPCSPCSARASTSPSVPSVDWHRFRPPLPAG